MGTGTGIWAIEFATQNPQAEVIGSDLSPIQPLYVPPNCRFEVDDAEDEWSYTQKFDFIHGRLLFTCFNNPSAVIKQAYDALAPGGYLEMQELNFKLHGVDESFKDTNLEKWGPLCAAGGRVLNKDFYCTIKFKQYFIDAGFEDVVETIFTWPSNTWPKRKEDKMLGLYTMTNVSDGIYGMSARSFTAGLGWTAQELEVFLASARQDLKNRAIHAYWPIHVIYGRKPK
ncbi:hypothetical protein BP6252_11248 [Coleophoma cylindrospora]|uniref:Methyltransferase domain-containing protein n=1 Tax=Coleophoma cylindrospora TaxID=1849047 RepID=A0A3D8QPF5_9HELO|nr:hypothetical protein BP6252_11248 [Coleophoma cylindrospora]